MKKYLAVAAFLFTAMLAQAQSDQELNRDSVVGWKYVTNPPTSKAVYKIFKSQNGNKETYTAWQQQASDMLLSWIQQSYLPRGLVMRTIAKNDQRWSLFGNGPLHSYGVDFLGYSTHFVSGKIDLHCCEQGQRLVAGFNDFPGTYISGFNPDGLYFFAEYPQFGTSDDDNKLSEEGVDKQIQPNLHNYRTYLTHYHDNGSAFNNISIVVGKWPFQTLLVKDAIAYINKQLDAYPGILQKLDDYSVKEIKDVLEKLKPYYNEPVRIRSIGNVNIQPNDGNGHSVIDPRSILNGREPAKKYYRDYYSLVTTTQKIIDQSKSDNPLWVYFNFTPMSTALKGTPATFDTKFGTDVSHMVYSMLNNFNFDFAAKWLAQTDARKSMVYTPVKAPAKFTTNNIATRVTVSAAASSKNKDPYTILFDDFAGYPAGTLSAKGWHTYGHNGHDFANATVSGVNGKSGQWVSIPDQFSFYPDFGKTLGNSFTVNYDVYFGKEVRNQRTPIYFRMDVLDPSPKKNGPIDLHDMNRDGFQFTLAMNGETETSNRYMSVSYNEKIGNVRIPTAKAGDVAHVSISVNGAAAVVSVNGKEIMHDGNALPAGKAFKRYGWYCSENGIYLGNIYVKNGSPVQK